MDILNTTEQHTLHGWITRLMNYMSVKLIQIFINNKEVAMRYAKRVLTPICHKNSNKRKGLTRSLS